MDRCIIYIYPPAVHPPFPSFSITQTTQLLALYSVTLGLTPGLTFFHPSSSSPFFLIFLWYFLTSWCVSSGFYHHLLPPPPPPPILQLGPLTCQTGCHCVYLCVCGVPPRGHSSSCCVSFLVSARLRKEGGKRKRNQLEPNEGEPCVYLVHVSKRERKRVYHQTQGKTLNPLYASSFALWNNPSVPLFFTKTENLWLMSSAWVPNCTTPLERGGKEGRGERQVLSKDMFFSSSSPTSR